jgi:hypothetical protein
MVRKSRNGTKQKPVRRFDRIASMVSMIDYLIVEAREEEPMAEYFLKMARAALLEAEQTSADKQGRH